MLVDDDVVGMGPGVHLEALELAGGGVEPGDVVAGLTDEPDFSVRRDDGIAGPALFPGNRPFLDRHRRRILPEQGHRRCGEGQHQCGKQGKELHGFLDLRESGWQITPEASGPEAEAQSPRRPYLTACACSRLGFSARCSAWLLAWARPRAGHRRVRSRGWSRPGST